MPFSCTIQRRMASRVHPSLYPYSLPFKVENTSYTFKEASKNSRLPGEEARVILTLDSCCRRQEGSTFACYEG